VDRFSFTAAHIRYILTESGPVPWLSFAVGWLTAAVSSEITFQRRNGFIALFLMVKRKILPLCYFLASACCRQSQQNLTSRCASSSKKLDHIWRAASSALWHVQSYGEHTTEAHLGSGWFCMNRLGSGGWCTRFFSWRGPVEGSCEHTNGSLVVSSWSVARLVGRFLVSRSVGRLAG
jgi:hypothetical protein